MTTASYGEEPKGTSTMDLAEKIHIHLLFPDVKSCEYERKGKVN